MRGPLVAMAIAIMVAGCGSAIGHDSGRPAGSDHEVQITLGAPDMREAGSVEGIARRMEQLADAHMRRTCDAEGGKPLILRRAQTNINVMLTTFRCAR